MSTYSMNMARAIRWYAMTGDLAHILTRMRHLMVVELAFHLREQRNKKKGVNFCLCVFFHFLNRQCKVKMVTSMAFFYYGSILKKKY